MQRTTSRSETINFYSESSRDLILATKPIFLATVNHLEPFSKVSEPPEGQERGGGAVGGQGRHQGVKL